MNEQQIETTMKVWVDKGFEPDRLHAITTAAATEHVAAPKPDATAEAIKAQVTKWLRAGVIEPESLVELSAKVTGAELDEADTKGDEAKEASAKAKDAAKAAANKAEADAKGGKRS